MLRTRSAFAALSAATLALLVAGPIGTASAADDPVPAPATFASAYTAMATPDMVIKRPGRADAGYGGCLRHLQLPAQQRP